MKTYKTYMSNSSVELHSVGNKFATYVNSKLIGEFDAYQTALNEAAKYIDKEKYEKENREITTKTDQESSAKAEVTESERRTLPEASRKSAGKKAGSKLRRVGEGA